MILEKGISIDVQAKVLVIIVMATLMIIILIVNHKEGDNLQNNYRNAGNYDNDYIKVTKRYLRNKKQ